MNVKNVFRTYHSSTFYQKILYSYLLISCVIFSIFSFFLFLYTNRDYSVTLENTQEYIITQAYNVNQTILKDIIGYCYNIMDTTAMSDILYGKNYSSNLALEATELNNNIRNISSLIESVYFINFNTETIMDQNGRVAISNHPDAGLFDLLSEMTPSIRPLFCQPRTMNLLAGSKATSVSVLTTIFYSNSSGALVVNLDYDAYYSMLALDTSQYIDIVLISSTGLVLSASDSRLFAQDYSQNELYQKIQEEESNSGSFLYKQESGNVSVMYLKNIGLDITYICTLNELYIYPGNTYLLSLIKYAAIYLLAGFLISLLLSRMIYSPIGRLKSSIAGHPVSAELFPPDFPSETDDIDYLSHAYRKILDINTNLQDTRSAYLEEQNKKLFKELLADTPNVSAIAPAELEALSAAFPEKNNVILLLGLDPTPQQAELQPEIGLLRYVIQNVMDELLSSAFTVRYIETDTPYVVFLLNYSEPQPKTVLRLIQEGQAFVEKHYSATFSGGLGDAVEELTELSLSYSSAYEAYSQRFLSGNKSVHTASELHLASVSDQIYPFEIGDALISAVKSLSREDTVRQLHAFFAVLHTYHIEQILCYSLQLASSLQRLEHSYCIAAEGNWNYSTLEQSTLNGIEKTFLERCLSDIEQIAMIKEVSSEKKGLIEKIETLVEENLYNPNLSVMFLADNVHLSVNYLSIIFKENTGESLSAYITQKKLNLVKELLLHTSLSLNEISDKLGFSTRNYFFTFFKKHTGMTPGDYRKKMGQEQI